MTTAHCPTFDPAKGGTGRNEGDLSKLSKQYSSRDMPSHMSLKYRQIGQVHPDEVCGKNRRREIEERELSTTKDNDRRSRSKSSSVSSVASKRSKLDGADTPATGNRGRRPGRLGRGRERGRRLRRRVGVDDRARANPEGTRGRESS